MGGEGEGEGGEGGGGEGRRGRREGGGRANQSAPSNSNQRPPSQDQTDDPFSTKRSLMPSWSGGGGEGGGGEETKRWEVNRPLMILPGRVAVNDCGIRRFSLVARSAFSKSCGEPLAKEATQTSLVSMLVFCGLTCQVGCASNCAPHTKYYPRKRNEHERSVYEDHKSGLSKGKDEFGACEDRADDSEQSDETTEQPRNRKCIGPAMKSWAGEQPGT